MKELHLANTLSFPLIHVGTCDNLTSCILQLYNHFPSSSTSTPHLSMASSQASPITPSCRSNNDQDPVQMLDVNQQELVNSLLNDNLDSEAFVRLWLKLKETGAGVPISAIWERSTAQNEMEDINDFLPVSQKVNDFLNDTDFQIFGISLSVEDYFLSHGTDFNTDKRHLIHNCRLKVICGRIMTLAVVVYRLKGFWQEEPEVLTTDFFFSLQDPDVLVSGF